MAQTHTGGFPRIGARRELKFALEAFWRGDSDAQSLEDTGRMLRQRHWAMQRDAGIALVPAGDFSFYDGVLDVTALLGASPSRFGFEPAALTLDQYFELARANARQPALEMTKWFDTNYHYLVPELDPRTTFEGGIDRFFEEVREAQASGAAVKPVLVGPVTYLWLAKSRTPGFDRLALLPALVAGYRRVLERLAAMGIQWVQLDEPALVTGLDGAWLDAYDVAYHALEGAGVRILLATYFDSVADCAARIATLPVDGFHIDLVRAPQQLEPWLDVLPREAILSAGVIDGRNVWRADLRAILRALTPLHDRLAERLWLAPSCSLLHVPVTLAAETRFDPEVVPWLAFAREKLDELSVVARGLERGSGAIAESLSASDAVQQSRKTSKRITNELVREALSTAEDSMFERRSAWPERSRRQRARLNLPMLPTTTIGSFPQTSQIRQARAAYRRRDLSALEYLQRIRAEIETAVRRQEALGVDVLVHGEAERNDMVEYFAESLWGYAITQEGWVQSYGSRCVKPPIIYGDVYRNEPITVDVATYAQSLTDKPVKGMLTGPVTMLQWAFVRDDQPREDTVLQIALAVRGEVEDLERAGIGVIQIDEPALREGLPLKRADWPRYLEWAVRAFKLSAAGARDETQIHTHMCYSEFSDILPAIAALDADVITIETSRSDMELLEAFRAFQYPAEIGPGVFDVHTPRVPTVEEMLKLLRHAAESIPLDRLWVNPDCGLKTRGWLEVEAALANMVQAARTMREAVAVAAPG